MKKIGIDFGTTNTKISYMVDGKIASYKLLGEDYIPSVLSMRNNNIGIGESAKEQIGQSNIKIFQYFKMLLGYLDSAKEYGYDEDNSPCKISSIYLQKLIEQYKKDQRLNQELESLVVTVPAIWIEDSKISYNKLVDILKTLSQNSQIYKEPEAAVTYYCHYYKEKNNKPFGGYILVIDYGGGTLDLSLAKVENSNIQIIQTTGTGELNQHLGSAGVAFDEDIITSLFGDKHPKYDSLVYEFERKKIKLKSAGLDESLNLYSIEKDMDDAIFEIEGKEIKPSTIMSSYNKIIKPALQKALTKIDKDLNHDIKNNLKIVLVGGFSNFLPVQLQVEEFFNLKTEDAKRRFFEPLLRQEDIPFAISFGATLLAPKLYKIIQTNVIEIGIIASHMEFNPAKKSFDSIDKKEVLLKRGIPLNELESIKYSAQEYQTGANSNEETTIELYFEGNSGIEKIKIKLKDIDSKFIAKDAKFSFGVSVNREQIYTLHIVAKINNKEEKSNITLGDLMIKLNKIKRITNE